MLQAEAAEPSTSTWSVTPSPNPTGSEGAYLYDVSCTRLTFCMAVGNNYTGSETQTLAETWDGTAWSVVSSPNEGSQLNYLNGVSCVRPTFCVAAGYYTNNNKSNSFTLVETWNGSSWSVIPSPSPSPSSFDSLNGVSCTSSTSCVAVGYNGLNTLIESWNGTVWSVMSSPSEGSSSELQSVKCISSTNCIAVGAALVNGSDAPLIESWNGTKWKNEFRVSGGDDEDLNGVSCTSSTNCVAVGSQNGPADNGGQTLIWAWNGTTWSAISSPNEGIGDSLSSVSCTNSKRCVAVGVYFLSINCDQTLIEKWNGTHWKITPSPNPGGSSNDNSNVLSGVSCAKSTFCEAVGTYLNVSTYKSLVETGS